jgi:hypothetical protein
VVAPLRNETGEIEYFFGAQVDVSSLFHKHNDLSAILSKDFALSEPPASEARKSFFRRLSEKTRIHTKPLMPLTPGLEEEVVRENITIGEQMDVFRSAYARVHSPFPSPEISIISPFTEYVIGQLVVSIAFLVLLGSC